MCCLKYGYLVKGSLHQVNYHSHPHYLSLFSFGENFTELLSSSHLTNFNYTMQGINHIHHDIH